MVWSTHAGASLKVSLEVHPERRFLRKVLLENKRLTDRKLTRRTLSGSLSRDGHGSKIPQFFRIPRFFWPLEPIVLRQKSSVSL
jgi:hypothetical protein